jgi:chromatin segregation and condensation protein Rec8/ScpA/Scc1 (kleisin family)
MKVGSELNFAQRVLEDLERSGGLLNQELVADLTQFQRYCGALERHHKRLRKVREKLERKRAEKEQPTEEEKPLLEALTTQRRSLEEVRRRLSDGVSLEDLFTHLKSLYRKGHVEIEVRKRE